MANPLHISGTDVANWASRRSAQETLPILIRRLLRASTSSIGQLSFRAGEGIQFAGYDGIVVVEASTCPHVPVGASVWELSTEADPGSKAGRDYDKRSANPGGIVPARTTYVALSARRWSKKDEWARQKRENGVWRDVRALDADDIETWLEGHPAVASWFAPHVGKSTEGTSTFDEAWKAWSELTSPPLSPALLIAGREESARDLCSRLQTGDSSVAVQAGSRDESYGFVLAALALLDADALDALRSHLLVVDDSTALRAQASRQTGQLLFLIRNADEDAMAFALSRGHRVVYPLGRSTTARGRGLFQVPKLRHEQALGALKGMGVASSEAGLLAQLARRSFRTLRRRLARSGLLEGPSWSRGSAVKALASVFLLGAWDEAKEEDRRVVERMTGQKYAELRADLQLWAQEDEPPVVLVGSEWRVVSREDLWDQVRPQATRDLLTCFRACVSDVLLAPDPRLELEPDQRWMAAVLGKVPPYSSALTEGMIESLAYLGSLDEEEDQPLWLVPSVRQSVKALLTAAEADAAQWISLTRHFRGLAEAWPEGFLAFVERSLASGIVQARDVFADHTDPMFTSSPHTEVLWALELVSWSPRFLGRATLLMARLAELDPGGRLSNRPINSLKSVFCSWCPQTDAGVEVREGVLTRLRQTHPSVAWRVLELLMPKGHDSGSYNPVPKWRPWGDGQHERRVSRGDYHRFLTYVVTAELQDVGASVDQWIDLVGHYGSISPDHREQLRAQLQAIDVGDMTDAERARLQGAIRQLVSRHRSYPDADWALDKADLDALAAVGLLFEPRSAAHRCAWLFGSWPQLPEGREQKYEEHQRELRRHQGEAIGTVFAEASASGIEELASLAELPGVVGACFGSSGIDLPDEDAFLCKHLGSEVVALRALAIGYVSGRASAQGHQWVESRLASLGATLNVMQKRDLMLGLRPDERTWDLAASQGADVDDAYWDAVRLMHVELPLLERAVVRLRERGRPFAAVDLVAMHHKEDLNPTFLLETLEAVLTDDPDQPGQGIDYWIPLLLDRLIDVEGIDQSRLARLEWALLGLFDGHGRSPKVLHRELAQSPSLLVDLMALVYRGEGEEERDIDESEGRRVRQAYRLLSGFRRCPGCSEDGTVDGVALTSWIEEVRRLARERGRGRVVDNKIGDVLSGCPAGADGVWPHEAVREVIEAIASEEVEGGLIIGIRNARGGTSRALDEGGVQERQLEKQYRERAVALGGRWPRTAAVLEAVAEDYANDAKREDLEAEGWEDDLA